MFAEAAMDSDGKVQMPTADSTPGSPGASGGLNKQAQLKTTAKKQQKLRRNITLSGDDGMNAEFNEKMWALQKEIK